MPDPKIGFAGTGLMGTAMVLRLLGAGHGVTVWNRSVEKTKAAVDNGARLAASPRDLASDCDVVMVCLTDARAVEAVVFGPQGIAEARGPKFLIDFSSMDPDLTRRFAQRLKSLNGMSWVDAPVSGGTPAAAAGTLTVMAGGEADDVAAVMPLIEPLAQKITHMGPSGAGQMTKLVNQVIAGCTMAVVAEAVNFAARTGVDAGRLTDALAGGFADSKVFQLLAPRMAARQFEDPLGTVAMMLKDLDTVVAKGDGVAALPMTDAAIALMREAAEQGHAEEDISTIVLALSDPV